MIVRQIRLRVEEERVVLDIELEVADVAEDGRVRQVRVVALDLTGEIVQVEHDFVVEELDQRSGVRQGHVGDAQPLDIELELHHVGNVDRPVANGEIVLRNFIKGLVDEVGLEIVEELNNVSESDTYRLCVDQLDSVITLRCVDVLDAVLQVHPVRSLVNRRTIDDLGGHCCH